MTALYTDWKWSLAYKLQSIFFGNKESTYAQPLPCLPRVQGGIGCVSLHSSLSTWDSPCSSTSSLLPFSPKGGLATYWKPVRFELLNHFVLFFDYFFFNSPPWMWSTTLTVEIAEFLVVFPHQDWCPWRSKAQLQHLAYITVCCSWKFAVSFPCTWHKSHLLKVRCHRNAVIMPLPAFAQQMLIKGRLMDITIETVS